MKRMKLLFPAPQPALRVFLLLAALLLLSACRPGLITSGTALPTAIKVTPTPNLCDKANIGKEIVKVHNVLREFEQVLFLAQNALPSQMMSPLMKMQDIRHQGETQEAPECLKALKTKRDNYMGARIIHVAHFMGGVAKEQLDKEGEVVNTYQNEYKNELAALLAQHSLTPMNETPAAPPAMPVPPTQPAVTPAAQLPEPTQPPPAPADTGVVAVNEQGRDLLMRQVPNSEAPATGAFKNGERLPAAAKSQDGIWVQLRLPDNQTAWVEREWIRLEGDENSLPLIQP